MKNYKHYLATISITVIALFVVGLSVAKADTSVPILTTTIFDANQNATTSIAGGSVVRDIVTVASATSSSTTTPTGTVDFILFPNTTCFATSTSEVGIPLVNGMGTSSTTVVPSTGLSYLAFYNGDALYSSTAGGCEPLTATVAPVSTTSVPTVTTTILDANQNATTSVAVGSSVSDQVVVTSATSSSTTTPTGTVDFTMFPNTTCSATGTVQSGVALVNGIATSSSVIASSTGLSFMANYNGDTLYASSSSPCESLTAVATSTGGGGTGTTTANVPVITTTVLDANQNATTSVAVGSSVSDKITVGSGTSTSTTTPTGTVDVTTFPDMTCSATGTTEAGLVLVNGVATTSSTTVPSTGLSFAARYNGDSLYASTTSTCESLTAVATSTGGGGTGTTTPGSGSISGTVYNDVNQNGALDSGEQGLSGWTINLYTGANFPGTSNGQGPQMTMISDSNGNYSFSNLADGVYSIEEINQSQNPLKQFTSDYSSVTISGGSTVAHIDFGNALNANNNNKNRHDRFFQNKEDHRDNGIGNGGISGDGRGRRGIDNSSSTTIDAASSTDTSSSTTIDATSSTDNSATVDSSSDSTTVSSGDNGSRFGSGRGNGEGRGGGRGNR